MAEPWNEGVRGTQVLPLINSDARTIVCEAGPGTGKTFGLVRRIQRILHADGLGVDGSEVLVVAFNRVIAKALREDIEARLKQSKHSGKLPTISTIHALCRQAIGRDLRLLLDHEREPMLYDVLTLAPSLKGTFKKHRDASQALAAHEAGHVVHRALWQAVDQWLVRHQAELLSGLPKLLLDHLKGGDFSERTYEHVLVDEYQDLTFGEQELFLRLVKPNGFFVALGDRRQSIYAFRGNDPSGLESVGNQRMDVLDVPMNECTRCPTEIVRTSNELMTLSGAAPMVSPGLKPGRVRLVHWGTPQNEAKGMAGVIMQNIDAQPAERHLVMVTRRQFGYRIRSELRKLRSDLEIHMNFSESLLESWASREAFLLFCLLADPDAPTWRAWLGYQNSATGHHFKAPQRNSKAYLQFLKECEDRITAEAVEALAKEAPPRSRGTGTKRLHERAQRFAALSESLSWNELQDPVSALDALFVPELWVSSSYEDAETAKQDLGLLLAQSRALLEEITDEDADAKTKLRRVVRDLRYLIATREPLRTTTDDGDDSKESEAPALQIATLWGAKGVTADQVYLVGLCGEAIPGDRRPDYPGTDAEFLEEQRRLFYVSITRTTNTLILSRPTKIRPGDAQRLGLSVQGYGQWVELRMSKFLRDILEFLPESVAGAKFKL